MSERTFAQDLDFQTTVQEYIKAGYQILFIQTTEEARVEHELRELAKRLNRGAATGMGYVCWDCRVGFSTLATDSPDAQLLKNAANAVEAVIAKEPFIGNAIFHFKDLLAFQNDVNLRRMLRNISEGNLAVNRQWRRPIVITGVQEVIHDEVKPGLTSVDFKLPDDTAIQHIVDAVTQGLPDTCMRDPSPVLRDTTVSALRGLTSAEVENTLSLCIVRHQGFVPAILPTIRDEKARIVKKSEVLTYIPESLQASREEIGGFQNLLKYIDRRKLAYTPAARAVNLDYPKGIVLAGTPGTGKSFVAKAIARLLGLPGYILDVSAVFGSLVGQSEARMRGALRTVEAQQGCVLLIDEADKVLSGASDSHGDSGVTRRIFGQLLTWLAEKRDRTFVIVTLNRIQGIPTEFFRAGRFDALFWTDMPNAADREAILKIHLQKRGVDPASLDMGPAEWQDLVARTENFVGAELEELITEARYLAFENRQSGTPTLEEFFAAKASIIPLSQLDAAGIAAIREYCQGRMRPVGEDNSASRKRRTAQRTISMQ